METPDTTINSLPTRARELVQALNLVPHPEGCLFVETWRSGAPPMRSRGQTDTAVAESALVHTDRGARRTDGEARRNWLSSIYYVLTSAAPVERLSVALSDAVYFFHGGSPVEYVLVERRAEQDDDDDGGAWSIRRVVLGTAVLHGQVPQVGVRGGTWSGARLLADGVHDFALFGKALAPAFDYNDFEHVDERVVRRECPHLLDDLSPFLVEQRGSFDELYDDNDARAQRLRERTGSAPPRQEE